ncbi:uncharacterized protein LOC143030149 [Oratosquilla oratoria]|uniref:uncharacterized protein LOC143030149 n=1 Tax=Oratosquilla oratoria TaxID=337810 RepID=UPI003F76786C
MAQLGPSLTLDMMVEVLAINRRRNSFGCEPVGADVWLRLPLDGRHQLPGNRDVLPRLPFTRPQTAAYHQIPSRKLLLHIIRFLPESCCCGWLAGWMLQIRSNSRRKNSSSR